MTASVSWRGGSILRGSRSQSQSRCRRSTPFSPLWALPAWGPRPRTQSPSPSLPTKGSRQMQQQAKARRVDSSTDDEVEEGEVEEERYLRSKPQASNQDKGKGKATSSTTLVRPMRELSTNGECFDSRMRVILEMPRIGLD